MFGACFSVVTATLSLLDKDRQRYGIVILVHTYSRQRQVERKTSRVTIGHSTAVTKRATTGARQTQLALSQPPSPLGPPLFSCLGSAARLWFVDTFERTIFGALPRPKWSHNPDIYNPTPAGMFSLARFATSRRPPGALNHIPSMPYTSLTHNTVHDAPRLSKCAQLSVQATPGQ